MMKMRDQSAVQVCDVCWCMHDVHVLECMTAYLRCSESLMTISVRVRTSRWISNAILIHISFSSSAVVTTAQYIGNSEMQVFAMCNDSASTMILTQGYASDV